MSQENLELARRYFETFNAGGLDRAEQFWHPDIELWDPPNLPDPGRYVGKGAFREQVESYLALGWDGQFRAPEYVTADGEVLVIWQGHGRSPQGVPIEATVAQVFLFEDEKVRRVRQFLSRGEALEAVGLSE